MTLPKYSWVGMQVVDGPKDEIVIRVWVRPWHPAFWWLVACAAVRALVGRTR